MNVSFGVRARSGFAPTAASAPVRTCTRASTEVVGLSHEGGTFEMDRAGAL